MKIFFLSLAILVCGHWAEASSGLPSFEQVKRAYKSSELFLLDRQGRPLHQWRQNLKERSFMWTPLAKVSPALIRSVLMSEDQGFYSHRGVDFKALIASVYQRVFKNSSRGASTITMQLTKLIANDKDDYRGLVGKLRQILKATELESDWSKTEILEAYLNLVPFRGEYKGISSISWALFEKSPSGLTLKESTLLSVLIRAPNASERNWIQRACWQEPGLCQDFTNFVDEIKNKSLTKLEHQNALHLAQRLRISGARGELYTSIDKDLQTYIGELIHSQIQDLEGKNVQDAAVLVIENKTGQVWAYVGGAGVLSTKPYVDGITSLRQAGSTLKPFLYATAFEKNILHANSWIEDSAVDIVFDRGIYKPQNHDRQFYGWVKVKMALASSLNVPAVKVFKLLNDDSFWAKLQKMHFRNLQTSDHYGPALALGVADVTLEDLTQGYRTLAMGGEYTDLRFDLKEEIVSEQRIFSEQSANEVSGVLSQSENRTLGFGLDSVLALPGVSVKTGTSKDMRDNWCVGFNSRFTVGVWVGNFSGDPMWNVMGVTGAAPIWKKVMEWLHEKYPADDMSLAAAEDVSVEPQKYPQARIRYPQDGTIVAIDPGIPMSAQKIPLLVEAEDFKNLYWKINGKTKVLATQNFLWTPIKGRHSFGLYQNGQLKEQVHILVK